jgi:predicted SAM-dependent methyltransferase
MAPKPHTHYDLGLKINFEPHVGGSEFIAQILNTSIDSNKGGPEHQPASTMMNRKVVVANLMASNFRISSKALLKGFLYQELFCLEPKEKKTFKYSSLNVALGQIFSEKGHRLGSCPTLLAKSSRAWKLLDGKNVYLVKDVGDRLVVIRERHPRICRLIERVVYEPKSRYHQSKWRLRRWRSLESAALKKRWVDKPKKLLVNLGAGTWYVRDWKVLEYQGEWYRFARSFIDFEHDLTSNRPFPFANGSVHLFYSEHVFEHLKDEWCDYIFREANRCLEEGGGFRIVVPDADLIYDRLVEKDDAFFKSWMDRDNASLAEAFRTLVGHSRSPLDEMDFARRLSALSKVDFLDWCKEGLEYDLKRAGEHINWFNFAKLKRLLNNAGFVNVRLSAAQGSQFPEARGPCFDTRAWYSLHVECTKQSLPAFSAPLSANAIRQLSSREDQLP